MSGLGMFALSGLPQLAPAFAGAIGARRTENLYWSPPDTNTRRVACQPATKGLTFSQDNNFWSR